MATKAAMASRPGPSAGLPCTSSRTVNSRRPRGADRVAVEDMVGKFVYWLAVLAISLALVIALILFFESRDDSSLEGAAMPAPVALTGA